MFFYTHEQADQWNNILAQHLKECKECRYHGIMARPHSYSEA